LRAFFRRAIPPFTKVLLVESGSRYILDKLIPVLRKAYGSGMQVDLVTCFGGEPQGFDTATGKVYRVTDYPTPADRQKLYQELKANGYAVMGIICSAEPLMTKWKWALGAQVPAKIFVINENVDFFWLDWGQWRTILKFVAFRAGVTGASAIPTLARLLFFPLTLAYLLLFAASVHLRRRLRA
jgi:hypothetical protein